MMKKKTKKRRQRENRRELRDFLQREAEIKHFDRLLKKYEAERQIHERNYHKNYIA